MKKLAFVLAILMILLCSCKLIPGQHETETGTGTAPAATEPATGPATEPDTEPSTESSSIPSTEPVDTTPAFVPDYDADAAAYADISAKAEDDVRFRFVKAYIDGNGADMIRTLIEVDYYSWDGSFDEWIGAFEKLRGSFKITGYSAVAGSAINDYGSEEERVTFTFTVYESGSDIVPVGEKELFITNSYLDSTVWVTDHAISEKNFSLRPLIPAQAELLWWAIPCYDMISKGYTDGWDSDMVIMDTIFLTIPGYEYSGGAPGLTAEQLVDAAKELFSISAFNLTNPAAYVGDDGLYHVGGHGGISTFYELLSAEKNGDGFIVRLRLYADKAYLVPSDEYEIRIKPSDGLYDWVFDYVKLIKAGEVSPFFFEN